MSERPLRRKTDSFEGDILRFALLLVIVASPEVFACLDPRTWTIGLALVIDVVGMLGPIAFFLTRRRQWLTLTLLVTAGIGVFGFCIGLLYISGAT